MVGRRLVLIALLAARGAVAGPSGVDLGVGSLTESGTPCHVNCSYDALAPQLGFHVGMRESDRLALLFDVTLAVHRVDSPYFDGTAFIVQGTAMPAVRYTVVPPLWIEGGAGLAKHVALNHSDQLELGTGVGMMAAAGVALPASSEVTVEMQARIAVGLYDGGEAHTLAATFAVGLGF